MEKLATVAAVVYTQRMNWISSTIFVRKPFSVIISDEEKSNDNVNCIKLGKMCVWETVNGDTNFIEDVKIQ